MSKTSDHSHMIIRRWDGKAKEANVWNHLEQDPELFTPNSNCFVYLSIQHFKLHRPAFGVPFEKLVYAKCQPLITKASAVDLSTDYVQDPYQRSSTSQTTPCCSLCLEPPRSYDNDNLVRYHITTRNFFAWILGKPIVGPDPATALLALKLRMDIWRTPAVDNFSDLDKFVKSQGYGIHGDLQSLLTNHVKGLTHPVAGYRMIETHYQHKIVQQKRDTSDVVRFMSTRLQSLRRRISRSRMSLPAVDHSREASVSQTPSCETVDDTMSGALPSSVKIPLFWKPLKLSGSGQDLSVLIDEYNASSTLPQSNSSLTLSSSASENETGTNIGLHTDEILKEQQNRSSIAPEGSKVSSAWIRSIAREREPRSELSRALKSLPQQQHILARHSRRSSLTQPPSPIMEHIPTSSKNSVDEREEPSRTVKVSRSISSMINQPRTETATLNLARRRDGSSEAPKRHTYPSSAMNLSLPQEISNHSSHKSALIAPQKKIVCKACGKPRTNTADEKRLGCVRQLGQDESLLPRTRNGTTLQSNMVDSRGVLHPHRRLVNEQKGSDVIFTRFPSLKISRSVCVSDNGLDAKSLYQPTFGSQDQEYMDAISAERRSVLRGRQCSEICENVSQDSQGSAPKVTSTASPAIYELPATNINTASQPSDFSTKAHSISVKQYDSPHLINDSASAESTLSYHLRVTLAEANKNRPSSPLNTLPGNSVSWRIMNSADCLSRDNFHVSIDQSTFDSSNRTVIDSHLAQITAASAKLRNLPLDENQPSEKDNDTVLWRSQSLTTPLSTQTLRSRSSSVKRKLRNSLNICDAKRTKLVDEQVECSAEGDKILVLDSLGIYSMLSSPTEAHR